MHPNSVYTDSLPSENYGPTALFGLNCTVLHVALLIL